MRQCESHLDCRAALGHATTADTYWYLEATPVLLRQVSQATERLHEGSRNDG